MMNNLKANQSDASKSSAITLHLESRQHLTPFWSWLADYKHAQMFISLIRKILFWLLALTETVSERIAGGRGA